MMVEPLEVAPEYLALNRKYKPKVDWTVKPEFQKHLKNNNWRDPEYRKRNNICTEAHPSLYYEMDSGNIVCEGSTAANYDRDLNFFAKWIETPEGQKFMNKGGELDST